MARKNPTISDIPKQDKHEQMCDEMNDAVYTLRDKIRKPFPRNGEKLLPANLREAEKPEARVARKHIARLHKAFKAEK
jgi:hypothetical protein